MGEAGKFVQRESRIAIREALRKFALRTSITTGQLIYVCGTLSDDRKQLTTNDGSIYPAIVEGFPTTSYQCGFMINGSVVITVTSLFRPKTDASGSGYLILTDIGGGGGGGGGGGA